MATPNPQDYVSGDSIEWGALGRLIFGAVVGAVGTTVASGIFAVGDLVLSPIQYLADLYARLIQLWIGVGLAAYSGSWSEAAAFVSSSGPIAIVLSVALVLTAFWIVLKGVSHVR